MLYVPGHSNFVTEIASMQIVSADSLSLWQHPFLSLTTPFPTINDPFLQLLIRLLEIIIHNDLVEWTRRLVGKLHFLLCLAQT